MAALRWLRGNSPQLIPLMSERTVIGRHPNCQIVLDNVAISRHHAQILEFGGRYYLEDLRSRNGTYLNHKLVQGRAELHPGDVIQLCEYTFEFVENLSTEVASLSGQGNEEFAPTNRPSKYSREEIHVPVDSTTPPDHRDKEHAPPILSQLAVGEPQAVRINVRPELKLKTILHLGSLLCRATNRPALLNQMLESLFSIFPQADWGVVLIREQSTDRFVVDAQKTRQGFEEEKPPLSKTLLRHALREKQAVLSADTSQDERFDGSQSLQDLHIRSVMCAPLIDPTGNVVGALQISSHTLAQSFREEDLDLLVSVATQCALALSHMTLFDRLQKQRDLERELQFATQVQLGFLPHTSPHLDGYEFADCYEPAQRVGGDYFDYIRLDDDRWGVAVGDVAGKGVPAALLMARLHASTRYHLLSASHPGEALTQLNNDILTSGMGHRFVTMCLAVLDCRQHILTLANAGHLPPLRRNAQGQVEVLGREQSGMPLGITDHLRYNVSQITIHPSDTVLFYTDGVTEAMNPQNEIFGMKRVESSLAQGPHSCSELISWLVDEIERFSQSETQRDDICMVAFRRIH
ncbi:MAG: hypothetical protein KatS3mg113_0356 [Planctomycetaceae bacterium]|nr:MAG: hypothetical protein KatS3mg113_0356 [Planctomycetaceae bacterium]